VSPISLVCRQPARQPEPGPARLVGGDHPLDLPASRLGPLPVALDGGQQRLGRGLDGPLGFHARQTGYLAARCTELRAYIETNEGALIGYGERYRAGKPISSSRAEGAVDNLVHARMNKQRQMRWSLRGARRVLQVGAAVLDGRFGHPAIQLAA